MLKKKRTWLLTIGKMAAIAVFLLAVAVLGLIWYLHTASFRHWALAKVISTVEKRTGTRVQIQSLNLSLYPLVAEFGGVTAHGTESTQDKPLFHSEKIRIGLRILPLLHKEAEIDQLIVERPQLFLWTDSQGRKNLNLPSPRPSSANAFHLNVHYLAIHDGLIAYGNETIPLSADLRGFQTEVAAQPFSSTYRGHLNYRLGRVSVRNFRTIEHAFSAQFTLDDKQCVVDDWTLQAGRSRIGGRLQIAGFQHPIFSGNYQASVSGEDLNFILKNSSIPLGDIALRGNVRYAKSGSGADFLNSLNSEGQFSSASLNAGSADIRVDVRNLRGKYTLAHGTLQITQVAAQALGGALHSDFNRIDLRGNSGRLAAQLDHAQLVGLGYSVSQNQRKVRLASSADIGFHMQWNGGFGASQSHIKVSLRSASAYNSSPSAIPADGMLDFTYDAARERLLFADSSLIVGPTELRLSGEMSKHSSLNVRLNTGDVQSLLSVVSSIAPSPVLNSSSVRDLQGPVQFTGTLRGSLKSPTVDGQLSANNLVVEGTKWQSLQTHLSVTSQRLTLKSLLAASEQGQIQADATIPLADWSLDRTGRVSVDARIHSLPVETLQKTAASSYPVQGIVSGDIHLVGSIEKPSGHGHVDIAKAVVYGEPLTKAALDFDAQDQHVTLNGEAISTAGTVTARISYDPVSHNYNAQGKADNLNLGQLKSLQGKVQSVQGTLNATFNGKGTLDNPQVNLQVRSTNLQLHGEALSDLNAQFGILDHRAEISLTSRVQNADVRVTGHVELTANYLSDFTVETGPIPLGPLLQRYLPPQGNSASGEFQVRAHIVGPLKRPQELSGQVDIPKLHLVAKTFDLSSPSPIHFDVRAGIVQIKQFSLQGNGTFINFSGSVPLAKEGQFNFASHGSLDLAVLGAFVEGGNSSGKLTLDLQARGARQSPQIEGQINLANAAFFADAIPVGLESLNGNISIHGKHLEIDKLSGMAGGGQMSATGSADIGPHSTFGFSLKTTSTRIRENGVRAVVDADLSLNGSTASSTLGGQVVVHKLSFNAGSDLGEIIGAFAGDETVTESSPFKEKIKLNVAVHSDEQLAASSSQLSIAGTANLTLGGNLAAPIVFGRVTLNRGEVFFLGKRFEIRSGTVVFANTRRTNPVMNLNVGTRIEQYNITINLSGTVNRLRTTYTSDPALSTGDIINLLAFGQTTTEAAANAGAPAALGAESAVANAVGNQVAGKLQSVTGLSQLTIAPSLANAQNPGAQIAIQQRVTGNLLVTFSTDITTAQTQAVQLEYRAKRNVTISILRDQNGGYGLDVRYHKSF